MNKIFLHSFFVIKITFITIFTILPIHAADDIENFVVNNSQLSF